MQELVREGIIIEGAKWKEIFPLIKDDERFLNMLGQAGSTPLELFWDIVDGLETEFRLKRDYVLDVLDVHRSFTTLTQEKRYEVSESTNYEEFKSLMSTDLRTSVIPDPPLQRIFANILKKNQRHSNRPSRKKADAFRSLLRHMPEVTYESTWEAIRPLVANTEEFKALETEEERIIVFEKVIRRLKEKRDEEKRYREREGSARDSKRDREESRHRDRDRDGSRRGYDDDRDRSPGRSRARSRERSQHSRDYDRERNDRDRSRSYSKMDEIEPRDRSSKRRSEEDLRGDKKVHPLRIMPT